MNKNERFETMSRDECEDWLRWQRRGRFRFLLFQWGLFTISLTATLFLLGFFVEVWPELPWGLRFLASFVVAFVFSAPLAFVVGSFVWKISQHRYDAAISGGSIDVDARSRKKELVLYVLMFAPFFLMLGCAMWVPDRFGRGAIALCLGFWALMFAFRYYADKTWRKHDQINSESPQRDWVSIVQFAAIGGFLLAMGACDLINQWMGAE